MGRKQHRFFTRLYLQFANCNIHREKQYLQSGYELQNIILIVILNDMFSQDIVLEHTYKFSQFEAGWTLPPNFTQYRFPSKLDFDISTWTLL